MAWRQCLLCCLVVIAGSFAPGLCDVLDGVCQIGEGNVSVTYQACTPPASLLTRSASYNVTIIPESATCGAPPKSFCVQTWQFGCLNFETCDQNDPAKSHPKSFLFDESRDTFWASTTSSTGNAFKVVIQISFDKLYELSGSISLLFFSGRPREMIIEKSLNHRANWTVLQYYSTDCTKYSNVAQPKAELTTSNPTAVICTGDYSTAQPFTGGTVKFEDRHTLFLGALQTDYQSLFQALENDPNLRTFLSFTDIRITLLLPPAAGGYYGISNIDISGKCSCNLHASSCSLVDGYTVCNCSHNTDGKDCERCLPLYNERPWRRGSYLGEANECLKCECNDHADSCTYDSAYTTGVCNNCFHNTQGLHCQDCVDGYYHNTSVPLNDPNTCTLCNCEPSGVIPNSVGCSQTPDRDKPIGQCPCKPEVTGRRCDVCQDGFYGLFAEDQPGVCKPCGCNIIGTVGGSNTCRQDTGRCPCKNSTDGRLCGQCKSGYHGFPLDVTQECTACGCDWGGSISEVCDAASGKCTCRDNVQGDKCSELMDGAYFPSLDVNVLDPGSGSCTLDSAMQTTLLHDGEGFARCRSGQTVEFTELAGQMRQPQIQWPYRLAIRYSYNSQLPWPTGTLTVATPGNSGITDTSEYLSKQREPINTQLCPGIGQTKTYAVDFQPGSAEAWLSSVGEEIILDVRCRYKFTLVVGQKDPNEVNDHIVIDSVVPLPSLEEYPAYQSADNATKLQYDECVTNAAALSTKSEYIQSSTCHALSFSVGTQINLGASACDCDPRGTLAGSQCDGFGGQCTCKPGVSGRTCDACALGYYNFTDSGCTVCPASGCPLTTTTPKPETTPQENLTTTTTTTNDGDGSSMLFVYIALGVFLFALFVLCVILTVILCRRCLAVRRLKAEEGNQEQIKDGNASGSHPYKQFSDEEQSMRGYGYDDVSTISVRSLNLHLRSDGSDVGGYDAKSSSRSTPNTSIKSESLSMVTLNSNSAQKDNYQPARSSSRILRSESSFAKDSNGLPSQGRLPPDGMSSVISDETKQANSDKTQPPNDSASKAQPERNSGPATSDALPNLPRSTDSAASPRTSPTSATPYFATSKQNSPVVTTSRDSPGTKNTPITRTSMNANSTPTRSDLTPNYSRTSPVATNSQGPSTSISQNAAPTQSQNSPTLRNRPAENPSTSLAGVKQVPPQRAPITYPTVHNGQARVSQTEKQPTVLTTHPQTNATLTPPKNSADVSRQKTPLQIRKPKPPREFKELNPRTLFTNNNPNLNYAGFGEFDEINGSLV